MKHNGNEPWSRSEIANLDPPSSPSPFFEAIAAAIGVGLLGGAVYVIGVMAGWW